jgi:hypothetical protein
MKKSIIINTEEINQYIKDIRKIPVISHDRQEVIFEKLTKENLDKKEKKDKKKKDVSMKNKNIKDSKMKYEDLKSWKYRGRRKKEFNNKNLKIKGF